MTVVGIGPGMGQEGETPEFVREFVRRVELPMVIDADGLNAFAGKAELLKVAAQGRTIVLTPHPGEMARLVGMTVKEVEADRVGLARRFATEHGVTLVLKGWRTLVAHPDGRVAVNTTGNPSMAKGGSGDILTGIVAAMLAQYKDHVAEAVEAAVFLHGLAGGFCAVARRTEHTVLATRYGGTSVGGVSRAGNGCRWVGHGFAGWRRESALERVDDAEASADAKRGVGRQLALGEMITELLPAPKLVVLRGDPGSGEDDAG